MVFVCYVTLQDHIIKALNDFMVSPRHFRCWEDLCAHTRKKKRFYGLAPLKRSHHITKFDGHRHCGSGDIVVLVCHIISQDYVIKWSCDFMDESPLKPVIILRSSVAIATLVVEL